MSTKTFVKPYRDSPYAEAERGDGVYQKQLIGTFDGPNCDAFGRWRVSHPTTLFESKLLAADKQTLFWNESLESGAGISSSTPTAAKPYTDFTSTDTTAGVFTRQTRRRLTHNRH